MKTIPKLLMLFVFFACALTNPCHAQDTAKGDLIHEDFDMPPVPPGGDYGYAKYLADHIKYPAAALDAGARGTVYISMIINKDGIIKEAHVQKDEVGYGCAQEALRVIKMMPPWTPGKINGTPVTVKYMIPVKFMINDDKPARIANTAAEPAGGMNELLVFIQKNIKYPKEAIAANAQGTVYVSFIVNKHGRLTHIELKKDNVGYGCGKEAMRVVRKMKRWKPATVNGKRVKVQYTLPVRFSLR